MADVEKYLGLITPYHRRAPKFSAMVGAVTGDFVALQALYATMVQEFDLDTAEGVQLDAVGLWAGIGRRIRTPIAGVYFSLDTQDLGFDEGVWLGPYDPTTGVTILDDDTYRLLIKAKIGANHWDGTLEQSAAILNMIFGPETHVFIVDNQDMSIDIGISGQRPSALFLALLTGGYIPLKPEGVRVAYHVVTTEEDTPLFGFDVQNQFISGFDTGTWGDIL